MLFHLGIQQYVSLYCCGRMYCFFCLSVSSPPFAPFLLLLPLYICHLRKIHNNLCLHNTCPSPRVSHTLSPLPSMSLPFSSFVCSPTICSARLNWAGDGEPDHKDQTRQREYGCLKCYHFWKDFIQKPVKMYQQLKTKHRKNVRHPG